MSRLRAIPGALLNIRNFATLAHRRVDGTGGPAAVRAALLPQDHDGHAAFDTHKAVVATFGAAGHPAPETPITPRNR